MPHFQQSHADGGPMDEEEHAVPVGGHDKPPSRDGAAGPSLGAGNLNSFQFTFESILNDRPLRSIIEADSDGDTDVNCDSKSLTESILTFHEENGRTYSSYRPGAYLYPNDLTEVDRLDYQYEVLRILFEGRNYFAPWSAKKPPKKILDIGTGTGQWCIEMGDEFPDADIIGTEISPIMKEEVPPRVTFWLEDSSEDWLMEPDFDYIHTRMLLGSFVNFKEAIVRRAYNHLVPGGWFESQELLPIPICDDDTCPTDSPAMIWVEEIMGAADTIGRSLAIAHQLKQMYLEVGFVDVQELIFRIPCNSWPREPRYKEIGRLWGQNLSTGLNAFGLALLHRVLGRSAEEIEVQLVDVRRQFLDTNCHTYQRVYVVIGRKPYPHEVAEREAESSKPSTDVEMRT